jgi:uncharacterized coiled-coil DUF342 family protein
MLSDMPYQVAEDALIRVLATAKFFPTIAEIREAAVINTQPRLETAGEAYEKVLKAIRWYGSYREQEALESLEPMIRKATKAIGWKPLCLSEEPDVVRGQWRKAYEALEKRETTEAKVPEYLKQITAPMLKGYTLTEEDNALTKKLMAEKAEFLISKGIPEPS